MTLDELRTDAAHCTACPLYRTGTQLGPDFRVTRQRGEFTPSNPAPRVMATIHPSALLRIREDDRRAAEYQALVANLRKACK